jgi:hypothetical protein
VTENDNMALDEFMCGFALPVMRVSTVYLSSLTYNSYAKQADMETTNNRACGIYGSHLWQ